MLSELKCSEPRPQPKLKRVPGLVSATLFHVYFLHFIFTQLAGGLRLRIVVSVETGSLFSASPLEAIAQLSAHLGRGRLGREQARNALESQKALLSRVICPLEGQKMKTNTGEC